LSIAGNKQGENMLDTVKLCLNDWEIRDTSRLIVQPSPVNYGTGELTSDYQLWRNEKGDYQRGSKAFLNTETMNIDIKPFSSGGVQCFVHFSIPKIHNGENYYSVGREGTQAVMKKVEGELKEAGIRTNIEKASLSRIDTFKNVITEEPFLSYSPLFSTLEASRKIRRDYGTTFLWSNTQQELCIYDKIAEMEKKKIETSHYPAQTMRFEYRLLNKRKIDNVMGFSEVRELPGRWEELEKNFIKVWKKNIFNRTVEEIEVLSSQQVKILLEVFREESERNYINMLFNFWGTYTAGRDFGIEPLKIAIREIEEQKGTDKETINKKVYRAGKKLQEAQRKRELLLGRSQSKTMAGLYKELQEKVCMN